MGDPRLEPDAEETAVQVVEATALTQITKGEVDMQVTTARQYPRSIKKFQRDAMSMATIDEETAESCFYIIPRAGKKIEGPSVRLAEIVASAWGNIRAETRVIDESHKWVTSQAMCWDLERNVAIRTETRRRITDKNGRRYSDDMIAVTANAAASIALRNAIFKVVPFTYVKAVYDKCKAVAKGDIKTLTEKRSRWLDHWHKYGIVDEQVLAALGKPSVDDVGLDDVETMAGWSNGIKEGTVDIDDVFQPLKSDAASDEPTTGGGAALREKLRKQARTKKTATTAPKARPKQAARKPAPPKDEPPVTDEPPVETTEAPDPDETPTRATLFSSLYDTAAAVNMDETELKALALSTYGAKMEELQSKEIKGLIHEITTAASGTPGE